MESNTTEESGALRRANAADAKDGGAQAPAREVDPLGATARGYLAAGVTFFYPELGERRAPGGADVMLLTTGGVAVRGCWIDDGRYLGWAPLPKRDQKKEDVLMRRRGSKC